MNSSNTTVLNQKASGLIAISLSALILAACGSGSSKAPATDAGTESSGPLVTVDTSAGVTTEATDGTSSGATDAASAGSTDDTSTDDSSASSSASGSTDDVGVDAGASDGSSAGSTDDSDTGAADGSTQPVEPPPTIDPTPIVRAPADQQVLVSATLALAGSVTFNGTPLDIPVVKWVKKSGPGNAMFTDTSTANTSTSFDLAGTYVLELSASNGPHTAVDQMQVEVTSGIVNQPPSVNAGDDEVVTIDEVLNLSAVVEDDGLPTSTLSGSWNKMFGSGEVTFGELSSESTTASFSAVGNYVLEFSATDGELIANDSLKIEVKTAVQEPTPTSNINANNNWQNVSTANGSKSQSRHEAGAVAYQNRLYLMGGRGIRQVNRYNPTSNSWENLGSPDFELSHFQPVELGGKIYVLGSLDCCFPSETVIANIQIFNPANKKWTTGAALPQNRRRGSAGVVVHNNKIYIVGGSTNGHDGGMVNWFDEYNPANNQWKTLPNAPSKRDHFSAAIVGSKLVAAGGRQTDHPATFANLVANVDVYDFSTGKWTAGVNIPTKRAGAMTVSYGDEVILIGGEKDSGLPALSTVEAYNVKTNKWRTLDSLNTARHSGGAAIVGGAIHVVSGNLTTGGGNETQVHEKLNLD